MYKLEFKLKQHTPLIHFQHDQHGATLRATELKPKLDKFLIQKLKLTEKKGEKRIPKKEFENWFNNKEKLSLDYKVKISNDSNTDYYLPLPLSLKSKKYPKKANNLKQFISKESKINCSIIAPSPYFANADKIKFEKEEINEDQTKIDKLNFAVKAKEEISCQLLIFHTDLYKQIENYLYTFFLVNNFGTRQNKGFGSFHITKINDRTISLNIKAIENLSIAKSKRQRNIDETFSFILDEYQLLKSGKNFPSYKKSELFNYFINNNIRWEKRFLKKGINTNKILSKDLYWKNKPAPIDVDNNTNNDYNEYLDKQKNTYMYIRALLGLAEQFEYTIFREVKNKDTGKWEKSDSPDYKNKYIVSLEHIPKSDKDKIERFKSPILFKVINGITYLIKNDSYKLIEGEEFKFTLNLKGDKNDTIKDLKKLRIPRDFNLSEFLINHLNINNWEIFKNNDQ